MIDLLSVLPPGAIMALGALLAPLLPRSARLWYLLLLPALALFQIWQIDPGSYGEFALFGYDVVPLRVDRLSRVFGTIFCIAAALNLIYAACLNKTLQDVCGTIYAGAAIGATFAGDLISLFVWWELTAMSSVILIWCVGTEASLRAGLRYLIIQVISGLLLLAGAIVIGAETGSISFTAMTLDGLGPWLVFLAFGIKCAFPFLHNWLQDAYPEASVAGTVWLSAFSTKLAIYALARGFAGTEILIPIGAAMTAYPLYYAVIENDLRKVLSYSLNNQLGFMVVGIGIGTELALNGTAAHAFCHILYKSLLFMSMGAVLHRTGTVKASELGGLYKSMPLTTLFCIIGAMSISAFPLFSGFVSKSMVLGAVAGEGLVVVWLILLFASAGVLHHSGIKIPFFAFFAHDSGRRPEEAPTSMLIAMGIAAFLCVAIGVMPGPLYNLLPYPVDFEPYTGAHVVTQMQLLLFSVLAFGWLMRRGHYPAEIPSVNLDTDWIYREAVPGVVRPLLTELAAARDALQARGKDGLSWLIAGPLRGMFGPGGGLHNSPETGTSIAIAVLTLTLGFLIYFAQRG